MQPETLKSEDGFKAVGERITVSDLADLSAAEASRGQMWYYMGTSEVSDRFKSRKLLTQSELLFPM